MPEGKLTSKQELFCLEYIKDLNATQAAIRAGYPAKTAHKNSPRMMANDGIQQRIQELNASRFKKAEVEGVDVIKELAVLAFSSIKNHVEIDTGGSIVAKTIETMEGKSVNAISSIKEKRIIRETKGDSPDMIIENTFELKLWDKNKALENLGKHFKLFTDKIEVKDSDYEDYTTPELEQILKDLQNARQSAN